MVSQSDTSSNFLRKLIAEDLRTQKHGGRVVTRFPPEPNGYLHIGHAKSICVNFGLGGEFGGVTHLRFDDTNPVKEDTEYVNAIKEDVRWLGFEWFGKPRYTSDYFEQLYAWAVALITQGDAYVCELSVQAIREGRGTVHEAGVPSPYRDRPVDESLDLFRRMRAGEFEDGSYVLRAKINMSAPNMLLRDPLLYRIRHVHHHRTGDAWCIYPMYDFAHCLSDAIEGITHSICTLEFENNRALYDWAIEKCPVPYTPQQFEFARLSLTYTLMSKRKLLSLVEDKHVNGWDDPRLPTLAGLRRRGVPASAIRDFCDRIGVAKANSLVDVGLLEYCVRDQLNQTTPRMMAVLSPLKVVIENFPDHVEMLDLELWPKGHERSERRQVPFTREIYIDSADFSENPSVKFRRLAPGREVRLRSAYNIRCKSVIKDESGAVIELRCTYDEGSRGGLSSSGQKVKGTVHWVSATKGISAQVNVYERLFLVEEPGKETGDFIDDLNSGSLVVHQAVIEPALASASLGQRVQFERLGYFCRDSQSKALCFNRIVSLRDTSKPKKVERTPKKSVESSGRTEVKPQPVHTERPSVHLHDPILRGYFDRFTSLGLAQAAVLSQSHELAEWFSEAIESSKNPVSVANWTVNELLREVKERPLTEVKLKPGALTELVALVDAGTLSGKMAKGVFSTMLKTGQSPAQVVVSMGLKQITDPAAIDAIITELMDAFPDKVEAFRGGRKGLLGFFVGQVMKKTKGQAKPQLVQQRVQAGLLG